MSATMQNASACAGGRQPQYLFWEITMPFLGLGVLFLIIALVAYALGARGTAGMSASIGRLFLIVGIILAVIFAITGVVTWH
jgi:uncharacterized membrane protein YtjA (UPF0391 family)